MTIRNPIEWSADQVTTTARALKSAGQVFFRPEIDRTVSRLEIRRIRLADIKDVLASGLSDFGTYRTDVFFLCLLFPLIGLVLANITLRIGPVDLLFPLVSGFALVGPFAATGIYEMSRRQEEGKPVSWTDAFSIFGSQSFAAIIKLGLILIGIFALWLAVAMGLYRLTFGSAAPASMASFIHEVVGTRTGWTLIGAGGAVGFLFALGVFTISAVSFPLLVDRRVSVWMAVKTSMRAVWRNPVPMLAWAMIIAGSLFLATIPALVGLAIVLPVLGHATWHLYRKLVVAGPARATQAPPA